MIDKLKSDPQDGNGLLDQIRTIKATYINISESEATRLGAISERCDEILETPPTPDAAEGATIEVPHEDCLNCHCAPDERCAGYRIVSPKPAPDAVREALFKRESRAGGYAFVTAPAFPGWSFMLTPVCPDAREQEMRLSLVAFLEAEAALSAPVPSLDGVEPSVAWQNIDSIIGALEAAGCCRNGQVISSEDHVANTIRNWLRSLSVQSSNK